MIILSYQFVLYLQKHSPHLKEKILNIEQSHKELLPYIKKTNTFISIESAFKYSQFRLSYSHNITDRM